MKQKRKSEEIEKGQAASGGVEDECPQNRKSEETEGDEAASGKCPQSEIEAAIRRILPEAPDGLITLMKSQTRNIGDGQKYPRHRRWELDVISMALSLWCRSPRAYCALKESGMLVLPSERLLRYFYACYLFLCEFVDSWMHSILILKVIFRYYKNCMDQRPGFQADNLEWMVLEADRQSLCPSGRHGGLLIDEISVQDDIQVSYN